MSYEAEIKEFHKESKKDNIRFWVLFLIVIPLMVGVCVLFYVLGSDRPHPVLPDRAYNSIQQGEEYIAISAGSSRRAESYINAMYNEGYILIESTGGDIFTKNEYIFKRNSD